MNSRNALERERERKTEREREKQNNASMSECKVGGGGKHENTKVVFEWFHLGKRERQREAVQIESLREMK